MIKDLADIAIFVPSNNTQRIQEAHIIICFYYIFLSWKQNILET